jgi:isoleucyl-tRNA synthetase
LQKLRVTFKFLLGVLGDYAHRGQSSQPSADALTFADRAILYQLSTTSQNVWKAYDEYKFYKAVSDINSFVSSDLSAFYFEIVKDAAYAGSQDVRTRTQGVLATILEEMMNMLGPITPHLIEEVWEHFPGGMKTSNEHPLKRVWEGPYLAPQSDEDIDRQLEGFRYLSAAVKIAQEEARNAGRIGSGLACDVVVLVPTQMPNAAASKFEKDLEAWAKSNELADLLVVSNAVVTNTQRDYEAATDFEWKYEQDLNAPNLQGGKVAVLPPKQHKCVRCWKYTAEESDQPCQRCQEVLEDMKGG